MSRHDSGVNAEKVLSMYGGMASYAQLRRHLSKLQIRTAVSDGAIQRVRRGMYARSRTLKAVEIAESLNGVLSHHSAAEFLDMGTVIASNTIHVTVPANRSRVRAPDDVKVHYATLTPKEVRNNVTTPLRTVLDCARIYRFPHALAIAEAAIRADRVKKEELTSAAAWLRGRGSVHARKIVSASDSRPQSVMESYLRGLLLEAGITCFEPQLPVTIADGSTWHADLGDPHTRTLLEADSFTWHGHRKELADDCSRYNEFTALGYAILRVAYEHITGTPDAVIDVVRRTIAHRDSRNQDHDPNDRSIP